MSAKKKAVKRKPREWTRLAFYDVDQVIKLVHPNATRATIEAALAQGHPNVFRVKIVEVIK